MTSTEETNSCIIKSLEENILENRATSPEKSTNDVNEIIQAPTFQVKLVSRNKKTKARSKKENFPKKTSSVKDKKRMKVIKDSIKEADDDVPEVENYLPNNTDYSDVNAETTSNQLDDMKEDLSPQNVNKEKISSTDGEASDKNSDEFKAIFNILKNDKEKWKVVMDALNNTNSNNEVNNTDTSKKKRLNKKQSSPKKKVKVESSDETPPKNKSKFVQPATPATDRISRSAAAALRRDLLGTKLKEMNDSASIDSNSDDLTFSRKKDSFINLERNYKESPDSLSSSSEMNETKSNKNIEDASKKFIEDDNNNSSGDCQEDTNSLNNTKYDINDDNNLNLNTESNAIESSKLQNNSYDESLTNEDNQNGSDSLKKKLTLKKTKLKCQENDYQNSIEEKPKKKLKPGIFSNFKPSSLKEHFIADDDLNKTNNLKDDNSKLQSDVSSTNQGKDCESLSEKIERMKININDKKKTLRVTLRKLQHIKNSVKIPNDKIDESIKEIEDMSVTLEEDSVASGKTVIKEKEVNNNEKVPDVESKNDGELSSDEFSSTAKEDLENQIDEQCEQSVTSRPSSPIGKHHCSDKTNEKYETNGEEKTFTPEESASIKWKKNDTESDASETDSGNFKRSIKLKETDKIDPAFSPDEDDQFSLPDSDNALSTVNKADISFDDESNDLNITDESSVLDQNHPISPEGEEEKCFWDIDSDDERNESENNFNDFNFVTNSKKITSTKYLIDEESFDELDVADIEEIYVEEEAEEEEEEEEGEIIDIVGIPVHHGFDSSEKGYHTTEKIKISRKIPKCFVKKDPNPIEMVEIFDEKEDEKLQKKFGESSKWLKADFPSVVAFDVTHDILRNFCPYIFFDGICSVEDCAFSHTMPVEVLKKHPSEEVWLVIEFMLNQMTSKVNITHDFLESIFMYLDEKLNNDKNEIMDCIQKILLISAYIPFVGENREILWKLSLKVISKKGVVKWLAVRIIFKYVIEFFNEPLCKFSIVWVEMLESLEVDRFRRHVWDIVERLVEPCDFTLPPKFLSAALVDVANYDNVSESYFTNELSEVRRTKLNAFKLLTRQLLMIRSHKLPLLGQHELHVFLEKAGKISDLREPVCRIRHMLSLIDAPSDSHDELFPGSFDSMRSLKRSRSVADLRDMTVKRRLVENEVNNPPVFEREKMSAALNRALEVSDLDLVIKILKDNHKKLFYQGLINKLYVHYNKISNESHPIKNLLSKIHKDESVEAFVVKQSIGRIVVTLMFQFVKLTDWQNANILLMLLHAYKLNPITLEALVGECSQVRKAVTCSEIHYHSGHYKSAIKVLINYNLFKRENWKLKGDESDLVIVERISNYLLKKLIEKKEYEHVISLFKAIFQEIGEDQGEIDLMNYYEELLHGLFDEGEKYAMKCIELYCIVNEEDPTVVLGAVTFRTLLILAYRAGRHDIAFDIAEKCMRNNVYPPIQEKDRIIRLHKCLLEEELEIYITRWFKWFMKAHGLRSCPIKLQFTNDASEDKAMNSRFGMPKLLKQIDTSLKGSFNRLENVLCDVSNRSISSLKIKLKNDGIILSSEATDAIIRALLIFQEE